MRNPRQAVISGAKIELFRSGTHIAVAETTTGNEGEYALSSAESGSYRVEVHAKGFNIAVNNEVRVTADQMLSLDFTLAIESALNSITVQGTAEEGYRVDSVSGVGPFGALKLEDTPYSITVVPHALLQNLQPSSGEPVFEMIPGLQVALPQGTDIGIRINSRGFWVDTGEDGFRYSNYNIGPVDIEDKESTELLSGLSGFLYGTMDPGGFANYAHLSTRQEPCQTREACK